jgi:hypothetical protein
MREIDSASVKKNFERTVCFAAFCAQRTGAFFADERERSERQQRRTSITATKCTRFLLFFPN